MPQAGQILYYQDFEFPDDHSKKDKLLVILNNADEDAVCLVLKTTSQSRRYEGAQKGCNPQKGVFFVPLGWEQCFRVDTYIQLPQIFEIPTETLMVGDISGKVRVTSSLTVDCFKLLKDCLKRFKKDISEQHFTLVFGRKR